MEITLIVTPLSFYMNSNYELMNSPHLCSGQHFPSGTLTIGTYPTGQFMLVTGQVLL